MRKLFKLFNNIRKKDSGQGMVEYGLILALVSIVSIATLGVLGDGIKGSFEKVADSFDFVEVVEKHTVTFQDVNGKFIGMDSVSPGGQAKVPNKLKLNATEDMWDKPLDNIQSDGVITLSYAIIETADDLNNVRNKMDGKYIQVVDIDLGGIDNFEPIGRSGSVFTGTFDGGGYVISNLKINRAIDSVGLFGEATGATFKNIGLVNVNVTGGDVTGGLVGYQYGSSTVSNSYATGSVKGGYRTGGLVGRQDYSSVTDSYTTGSVTGGNDTGGLVGYQESSSVSNSFATGPVTGVDYVGGLLGYQYNSSISNSYATGEVTGGSQTGGLVGDQNGSSVSNSYWDKDTTKQESSEGGTGKTTAQMKNKGTYTDWDNAVWEIENNQYPTLR